MAGSSQSFPQQVPCCSRQQESLRNSTPPLLLGSRGTMGSYNVPCPPSLPCTIPDDFTYYIISDSMRVYVCITVEVHFLRHRLNTSDVKIGARKSQCGVLGKLALWVQTPLCPLQGHSYSGSLLFPLPKMGRCRSSPTQSCLRHIRCDPLCSSTCLRPSASLHVCSIFDIFSTLIT